MTRYLTIIAALLLTGFATQAIGATASLTPPKAVKKSAPVNAKQSFQLMTAKHIPGPFQTITTISVVWDWDFVKYRGTSFLVFTNQDIRKPKETWQLKTITATNGFPVKLVTGGHEFYAVQPSNPAYYFLKSCYAVNKPMHPKLYRP